MDFKPVYSYKTKDYTLLNMRLNGSQQILTFKTLVSGSKIRILLTNINNPHKMRILNMNVIINGIKYPVTVNNKTVFTMPAHSEFYSDVINVNIPFATSMVVTTRFSPFTKAYSASDFNSTKTINSKHKGMFNRELLLGIKTKAISKPHLQLVVLVKQVEVYGDFKTITWFGDSLTNHSHYTQPLQDKIFEKRKEIMLLNAGHSGNRLLKDGKNIMKAQFGQAGINRIHHDVFEYNNPDVVVVALGVNDLIHPGTTVSAKEFPTLEEMIEGYLNVLATIREHGAKAVICTITPFKGYNVAILDEANILRNKINDWIKTQTDFDHVIDIAAIVEDKADPSKLADPFKGDDHLHWSASGGQTVADHIDVDKLIELTI